MAIRKGSWVFVSEIRAPGNECVVRAFKNEGRDQDAVVDIEFSLRLLALEMLKFQSARKEMKFDVAIPRLPFKVSWSSSKKAFFISLFQISIEKLANGQLTGGKTSPHDELESCVRCLSQLFNRSVSVFTSQTYYQQPIVEKGDSENCYAVILSADPKLSTPSHESCHQLRKLYALYSSPTLCASRFTPKQSPFKLCTGGQISPHPKKVDRGGEDALFIIKNSFGVFDGIGSTMRRGIDSGIYAKKLATQVARYVVQHGAETVREALAYGAYTVQIPGASTVCIAGLRERILVGVNLGDSGLIVIRNGSIIFKTEPQQVSFNFPYQLSQKKPETIDEGTCFQIEVRCGDLIIAGSDGLWDNVYPERAARIVGNSLQISVRQMTETRMKNAANELATYAKVAARAKTGLSPFSAAAKAAGIDHEGGKMDDVSVLVSVVQGE